MNALVKKEVRLLLPAWGMVAILSTLSLSYIDSPMNAYIAFVGMSILAVTSFGREIASGTFSNLLAQPTDRRVIWWTKTGVLVTALAAIAGELWLGRGLILLKSASDEAWLWSLSIPVAIASGYWAVLLLRQVVAALWLAILMPTTLYLGVLTVGDRYAVSETGRANALLVSLTLYSVAGFWWSWRLYRKAQDAQWTGGTIAGGWLLSADSRVSRIRLCRRYRPFWALLKKEIRLQHITLLGIVGLLILHLGTVLLRWLSRGAAGDSWKDLEFVLAYFGFLWLIVPFFAAGAGMAEEYKLGTRDGLLCLPASGKRQFAVKLICATVIGGLLTALLFWSVEEIGFVAGVRRGVVRAIMESLFPAGVSLGQGNFMDRLELSSDNFDVSSLAKLSAIFTGISTLALFAASLSRNVLQTLLLGAVLALASCASFTWVVDSHKDGALGPGPLVVCFAIPLLFATFLHLAYRNFKSSSEAIRVWLRNLLAISGVAALSGVLGSAVYHRMWDAVLPSRPVHGPARLTVSAPPQIAFYYSRPDALSILFADGRLWVGCVHLRQHQFVEGSNWTSVAQGFQIIMGVRKDGTLWYAESTRHRYASSPIDEAHFEMQQFGNDSDWKQVDRGIWPLSFTLLKRDGTLWSLGLNDKDFPPDVQRKRYHPLWPRIASFSPSHFGPEEKWTEMFSDGRWRRLLRDENGAVWQVTWENRAGLPRPGWGVKKGVIRPTIIPEVNSRKECDFDESTQREFATRLWMYRALPRQAFEEHKWRSVMPERDFHLGVREDGTLWIWGRLPAAMDNTGSKWADAPIQIGNETNWRDAQNCASGYVLLKADGSLWVWSYTRPPDSKSWRRLDDHTDWIGLGPAGMGVFSLAADGGLWRWLPNEIEHHNSAFDVIPPFDLVPRSRPEFVGNILSEK